jgi:hypothetical protein
MTVLQRETTIVHADETEGLAPGSRYAAVTFDDAVVETLKRVVPEIVMRCIPCTVFVPTISGGLPAWHHGSGSRDLDSVVATADRIRALPTPT